MTLSWSPRKWTETRYIQEVHFTLYAAVWNICFLWLCESVPLSVSCPLLYFLTFVSGVASVLGLGFCFLVSFTVFFAFPLDLCNSESLSRLVSSALLQEIRLQLFTTALTLLVLFLISYRFTHCWILCLKNGREPIFIFFLQYWHIPPST